MTEDQAITMEEVIKQDGRYPMDAYALLHEGLARAVREAYGDSPDQQGPSHVTGQQLCQALREVALERWGALARTVLRRWNIRGTIDFGNMVYLMIEHDFMRKTDEDSIEDFRDVYDFDKALAVEDAFDIRE
jgi:uncharacterized repeat protein (TIGR04138 family)